MRARYHLIARLLFVAMLVSGLPRPALGAELPWLMAAISPRNTPAAANDWRIVISGNQSMSEEKLLAAARAELDLFLNQGQAATAVDDAAFLMELTYRQAGYSKALVDYEIKAESRQVLFLIQEGQQLMIKDIILQGNQGLSRDRILSLDPTIMEALNNRQTIPYVAGQIDSLTSSIKSLYLTEGYLFVKVQALPPAADGSQEPISVMISIEEGPHFSVGTITILGDVPPDLNTKISAISKAIEGKVFQRRQKLFLKTQLHDSYENAGYADVTITIREEIDEAHALAHLTAMITSGKPVMVKEIQVSGNEHTSTDFILSRLQLEPGQQYTLDNKRDSFSQLYQTGLFSQVDLRLSNAEGNDPGQKMVQVEVKERKAREVYVEPGWGSYELLRLKLGYKDSNTFGSGKILSVDSLVSTMGRSLQAGITDPWLLGSDISANLPIYYRYRTEPSFTLENSGVDLYLLKTIHKNVTINMGYQYSKKVVTDTGTEVNPLENGSNYHTASISGQLTRDTRDDIFFPTKGYRGNVALDLARPEFGGTIAYNRVLFGVRYFHQMSGGAIIGLRFKTGMILPAENQQSIPVAERFFNGGESSVRSFKASKIGPIDDKGDPLGGTAFSTYNLEWRKKITDNLAWSLFYDLGNVSPNRTLVNNKSPLTLDADTLIKATWDDYLSDFKSGVGAGLQYMLPVGPARLDMAFNPDRDATRNEADYVIHFSIGMAF
ncbi:MAG: outer membrane protein assembly factor BamA [Desulfobulbaceae bacterium]|nr:outer membrane protein assembly factor BamA [Desulfobulbaceae bacterium]